MKQTTQINYPSHSFFKQTLRLQLNQKEEQDSDLRLGLRENTQEISHSRCHSKTQQTNLKKSKQNPAESNINSATRRDSEVTRCKSQTKERKDATR